jgi:hypothetical protein
VRAGQAVPIGVFAGLVQLEVMVSLFDGGHCQSQRPQPWQYRDDQGGLATAG